MTRALISHGLLIASAAITTTSMAATSDSATDYVDSVHSWGAWALDIEPAAGGIQPQATQPLNARETRVSLRTNSISALSPQRALPDVITPNGPTPVPTTPAPTAPSAPTITPISPDIPIPSGGPAIPGGAP